MTSEAKLHVLVSVVLPRQRITVQPDGGQLILVLAHEGYAHGL